VRVIRAVRLGESEHTEGVDARARVCSDGRRRRRPPKALENLKLERDPVRTHGYTHKSTQLEGCDSIVRIRMCSATSYAYFSCDVSGYTRNVYALR
jgi:hypothetical protein